MAKVKKSSPTTPTLKPTVLNTKSVKISRNKNTKSDTKTEKSSKTSSITPHTKCTIKLKRFKPPVVCSSPHTKCTIKLKRFKPSVVASATTEPHEEVRRSQASGDQSTTKRKKFIDDVIKSSTPFKRIFSHSGREPFKVLNLQQSVCEFQNAMEDISEEEDLIKQPKITQATRESFKKLSLTKAKKIRKQKDKNDLSRFQPLRNSTLYSGANSKSANDNNKFNSISSLRVESLQDSEYKKNDVNTSSKENSRSFSSQNLANKSDIIEQLLLSDLDENPGDTVEPPLPAPPAQNNTHKFFHRTLETTTGTTNTLTKTQSVNQIKKSSKKINHKRRVTRKDKMSIGNVYEFLSQSQTSDSDNADKHLDPAADIIKKLIAEGKVQVATHKEGSGKLQLKRKNIPKKRAFVQRKQKKAREKKIKNAVPECEEQNYDDDGIAGDAILIPAEPSEATETYVSNSKQPKDSTAGGDSFSKLARSVLISQAGKTEKYRKRVTDQRQLLEAARKFVSTPFKRNLPSFDKTSIMSPIFPQGTSSPKPSCASPWRVDDDAHLPSVFYFNRNSDHLPSFSSDYIPSTPRKQQQQKKLPRYQDLLPDPLPHAATDSDLSFLPNIETENPTSPVVSSFSSNDSNAENMPPTPKHVHTDAPIDFNETIINHRQQLNPLRALSNRNPLKAINILEVITIPPLCPPNLKENEQNDGIANKSNKTTTQTTSKSRMSNMFGFDEFLESEDVTDADDHQVPPQFNDKSHNSSIRDKLNGLKYLRPVQTEPHQPSAVEKLSSTVFDDDNRQIDIKQRKIKEMFCSTMVNHECVHDNEMPAEKQAKKDDVRTEASKLFMDPDPITSFNEKDSRRTYVRPYKRKRKLRHNFVMFFDSDESGDDESNERERSFKNGDAEVELKKKKYRKDPKVNKELNSFVNDFNEMCNDVNQYELIVE